MARLKSGCFWAAARKNSPGAYVCYDSGEELIDKADVDAVLIAVPHYSHPPLAERAFRRGLNVLCEKPAGVYTKQVKEMNAAAEKSGKLFTMMYNQRTNPLYKKMHDIVAEGGIGDIRRVNWLITNWFRTQFYYDSGSWRATWRGEGGGIAAALGTVSPCIIIISIIAAFLSNFQDNVIVREAMTGVSICVVALILDAVLGLWKKGVRDKIGVAICALVFFLMEFTSVSPVAIVVGAALAGVIYKNAVVKREGVK